MDRFIDVEALSASARAKFFWKNKAGVFTALGKFARQKSRPKQAQNRKSRNTCIIGSGLVYFRDVEVVSTSEILNTVCR